MVVLLPLFRAILGSKETPACTLKMCTYAETGSLFTEKLRE